MGVESREQFNTWKDIVIPGLEADETYHGGKLRQMDVPRTIFAFFKGTIRNREGPSYSRGIRIKMRDAFEGERDVIFSEVKPGCNHKCYAEQMRQSIFCLCPRGWSPWTLRAYQAMMAGCIPVILADEIEFPFESTLDWSRLTVKIAERDSEKTLEILRAISTEEIQAKQEAITQVWRMVSYPIPSRPDDAFHSILRELGRKRRLMKASPSVFWT
ncbi:hypothetical protein CYMTET_19782 [Cymbomonas tetramitiformis]|uniref:Exostosin GT47 domain-containing protein n=1 Tax=Cymbomonas tetramitiformis TaxID=36881 RepID=A0AAE0G6M4_9CHLO|nr:hypothetical protein CYMTET_19782 [Cymbomonas tetramitiformis]